MHRLLALAFVVASLGMIGCRSVATPAPRETYTNPLLTRGADPWALWHDGSYVYMHTTGRNLVVWRTPDITDLKHAEQKTIWIPKERSNAKDLWAPEIHHFDGKWYVYYAADDGNTDNHQLYVLENTNTDPFKGEFVMKGRISTDKDHNWAIDGTVFEHRGQRYLFWSGWQTRRVSVETQCIYIARMKNPWTLASGRVLISKPEFAWERLNVSPQGGNPKHTIFVNEGPQPIASPDGKRIHVAYSASGCWTPYYALGLLTARADANLLDPRSWKKSQKPVFQQSQRNGVYSTGHNSFFKSPDGKEDYILYHARNTLNADAERMPRTQKFTWTSSGYPVFGEPQPDAKPLPKPSR